MHYELPAPQCVCKTQITSVINNAFIHYMVISKQLFKQNMHIFVGVPHSHVHSSAFGGATADGPTQAGCSDAEGGVCAPGAARQLLGVSLIPAGVQVSPWLCLHMVWFAQPLADAGMCQWPPTGRAEPCGPSLSPCRFNRMLASGACQHLGNLHHAICLPAEVMGKEAHDICFPKPSSMHRVSSVSENSTPPL